MPIRPELRHHYSQAAGWPAVCERIRSRAANLCECSGQCGGYHRGGRCGVPHLAWIARPQAEPDAWSCVVPLVGELTCRPAWFVRAVLGVAHLDHDPTHNADDNLLLLCQRCHLLMDRRQHASTREHARWSDQRRQGQLDLVLDVIARSAG